MRKIQWNKKNITLAIAIVIVAYLILCLVLTWFFPCQVFRSVTNHELCIIDSNKKNFEGYGTFTPIGVTGLFSAPAKEFFDFITAPFILPKIVKYTL